MQAQHNGASRLPQTHQAVQEAKFTAPDNMQAMPPPATPRCAVLRSLCYSPAASTRLILPCTRSTASGYSAAVDCE